MKIWFEQSYSDAYEDSCKIGINWYRHCKTHSWKGLTFHFFFFKYLFILNIVSNFEAYDRVINRYKYRKPIL